MSDPWDDEVAMEARNAAVNFEAVLISLRRDKNGINMVLSLSPHDVPDRILLAPVGSRYQIAAVLLDDQDHPVKQPKSEGELAVIRASILCEDEDFQEWTVKIGKALSPTKDNAKAAIYEVCGIASRKELRTNVEAREVFRRFVSLYEEHILKRAGP